MLSFIYHAIERYMVQSGVGVRALKRLLLNKNSLGRLRFTIFSAFNLLLPKRATLFFHQSTESTKWGTTLFLNHANLMQWNPQAALKVAFNLASSEFTDAAKMLDQVMS